MELSLMHYPTFTPWCICLSYQMLNQYGRRVQNTHIRTALRAGQRQVLIAVMGANHTISFQAATVISTNRFLFGTMCPTALNLVKKGLIVGTKTEVKRQAVQRWH